MVLHENALLPLSRYTQRHKTLQGSWAWGWGLGLRQTPSTLGPMTSELPANLIGLAKHLESFTKPLQGHGTKTENLALTPSYHLSCPEQWKGLQCWLKQNLNCPLSEGAKEPRDLRSKPRTPGTVPTEGQS